MVYGRIEERSDLKISLNLHVAYSVGVWFLDPYFFSMIQALCFVSQTLKQRPQTSGRLVAVQPCSLLVSNQYRYLQ